MQQNQTSQAMKDCIKTCLDCHQICTETATHVLHAGEGHSEAQHLVALLDCAQICAMCADFMARRSPHHTHVCAECAEICMACAKLCEAHQDPDGQMKRCAESCQRCGESCQAMAGTSK